MLNFLFIDTETTGLLHQSPRMVQLATLLCNEDGEELGSMSMIIKPAGFTIPDVVVNIHGITTEYANRVGLPLVLVLKMFRMYTLLTNYIVAHNIDFDLKILLIELEKANMLAEARAVSHIPNICTMRSTVNFCKLAKKKGGGYKWPKLGELYECVTGKTMEGEHSAHSDVAAMKESFFRLKEQGVIDV